MKKHIIYVICSIILLIASPPSYAGDFAYLTSYASGRSPKLLQISVTDEAVVNVIDMPEDESLGDMVTDGKGGCFLASYWLSDRYGRSIYHYDAETNRLEPFLKLNSMFGPNRMQKNGDELISIVEGNDITRQNSGVLFIDTKAKTIIKKIFMLENDPKYMSCSVISDYYDGQKYLYVSTMDFVKEEYPDQYVGEREGFGEIFVIDVTSREIYKTIKVPRIYDTLSGVVGVGDKIYVAAQEKGIAKPSVEKPLNKELLVFSLNKGVLISTIQVSPHPFKLAYDKLTHKLYVFHMDDREKHSNIEVIDVRTDKIVTNIKAQSQTTAAIVAPYRLYLSVGPGFMRGSSVKPGILVLNTKTDKITNRIDGIFQDISVNPRY